MDNVYHGKGRGEITDTKKIHIFTRLHPLHCSVKLEETQVRKGQIHCKTLNEKKLNRQAKTNHIK